MGEIEACRSCGQPFEKAEMGGQMPGTKEPEDVRCPHCGHTYQQRSNGYFQTHKLSAEAEEKWRAERAK